MLKNSIIPLFIILFNLNINSFTCLGMEKAQAENTDLKEIFNKDNRLKVLGYSSTNKKWYSSKIKSANKSLTIEFKLKQKGELLTPSIDIVKIFFYNKKTKNKNQAVFCFEQPSNKFKVNIASFI